MCLFLQRKRYSIVSHIAHLSLGPDTFSCWVLPEDIIDFGEYEEVFYDEIDKKISLDWTDGFHHAYVGHYYSLYHYPDLRQEDYRDFHLRERLLEAMRVLRSHFPNYKINPNEIVTPSTHQNPKSAAVEISSPSTTVKSDSAPAENH